MRILKNAIITVIGGILAIGYYAIEFRVVDSGNYFELILVIIGIAIMFGVIQVFSELWNLPNLLPVKNFDKIDRFISLKKTTRNVKIQIEENCRLWWCGLSGEEKKKIVAEIIRIPQYVLKEEFSVKEREKLIAKVSEDGVITKDIFVKSLKVIFNSGGLAEMRRQEALRQAEAATERKRRIEHVADVFIGSALKAAGVPKEKIGETVDEGKQKVEELVGEKITDLASRLFGKK